MTVSPTVAPHGASTASPDAPADEERLYHETMQALDAPAKEISALRKAGLLIGTLALSVLAFLWLGYSLLFLLTIVLVLLFHELGHYLGMRLFGYRDVRMFFIPFLGAAVSGRKYGVPVWQEAIVLLLGPLPGLVLAVALHWLYDPAPGSELQSLVLMLTFINAFNLLPVMPLDGGRLVNVLFFARQPYLAAGFQLLAGCALAAYAWLASSWVLGFLGVMLLLGVSSTYREARWGVALRAESLELPDEIERLNEPQRRLLFARAVQSAPQDQRNPTSLAAGLRAVYEHMLARRASFPATVLLVALYLSGFAVGAAGVFYRGGPLADAEAADHRGFSASMGGKRDEALAEYRKALAIREDYVAKYPTRVEGQYALSLSYAMLGHQAPVVERLSYLEKALAIREQLVEREPSVVRWEYELSRAHERLAGYYTDSRPEQALAHLSKAITLQEAAIVKDRHGDLGYAKSELAGLHWIAGSLLSQMSQPHQAVKHYRASLSIVEKGKAHLGALALKHEGLGGALAAAGDRAEAVEHLRKSAGLYQQEIATGKEIDVTLGRLGLDRVAHSLAPILLDLGRESEAIEIYRTALAVHEKYASEREAKETTEKGRPGPDTAWALAGVSWRALVARDFAKTLSAAERSLSMAPALRWAEVYRAHAMLLLGRTDEARATYLAHKGQPVDASKTWEQAVSEGFASLRRAGLAHAMMPEILKLLGSGE